MAIPGMHFHEMMTAVGAKYRIKDVTYDAIRIERKNDGMEKNRPTT